METAIEKEDKEVVHEFLNCLIAHSKELKEKDESYRSSMQH